MQDLAHRITLLVRARYPLIQLVTHEEDRVARLLDRVARDGGFARYGWRLTEGLAPAGGEAVAGTVEPEAALAAVAAVQEPALFVFHDLHPFLDRPEVVRRLRDLSGLVGPRRQAVVLVGRSSAVPPDLDKDAVVLDLPLPGPGEVAGILRALLDRRGIAVPPERFDRFVKGALGLTEREIKRLYARILLAGGRFGDDDLAALVEEKRQAIRKSRYLEFWDSAGSMDDVGGMDNLKAWLAERRAGFTPEARAFGLPEPRGVFLLGVQGCGKSLMAKAVADLWRLPLLRLDVAAIFETGGRGEAGRREGLRETVRVAESLAPVVLWIDEIEKGFLSEGAGASEAFGYFLTWMQEKSRPVFVVATANEVRSLPPELLRKGRFDEIFFVDLPNVHERLNILEIHLRLRGRDPERFDLTGLAEETEKFSGAELEQVVVSALFKAFAAGRDLELVDLLDVARETVPLAVTMDDHIKALREWARPRARRATLDRRRVDFFAEWEDLPA